MELQQNQETVNIGLQEYQTDIEYKNEQLKILQEKLERTEK